MRYFFATCVFLIATFNASGQSLPALLAAIEEAGTDSLKIQAYENIADRLRYRHADSALFFAMKGLTHARENGYEMGMGIMSNMIGKIHERHGQLELAENHYLEAREIFTRLRHKKGVAITTMALGVVSGRTGEYEKATRHFLDALSFFEETNDATGVVQCYIKLGVVSDHMGNLDQALDYYLKAESLNKDLPPANAALALLNNIGIIYGKRNDLRTALQYFQKGLRQSDPHTSTGVHIALLGSAGLAYDKLNMQDSAWFYQQQALTLARQNSMPEEEARSLVNMASLVEETDADQSLALLNEALHITERIRQMKLLTEIYDAMIELYKERSDYRQALMLTEKRQAITDSVFSIEKSKEIANLQTTHELSLRENEIQNLAMQNERSMFQRNVMIGVALLSIILIGIVWFYNRKISKLNTLLIKKQNELEGSNTVKDKLFSVLGHDLRAPMTRVIGLLNILATKHQPQEEKIIIEKLARQSTNTLETLDTLLLWGQRQLKGIKLDQKSIAVKEHVRKSIFLASDYAAQKNIRIVENVSPDLLVHADPSHFDFIVRNLLSNALKFSHSGGTVHVNAKAVDGGEIVVSISDAGVGIAPDRQTEIFSGSQGSHLGTWNEKGTGIGLLLSQEYVAENGGKLWLESEEGKGTTFFFSLQQRTVPQQQVLFPEEV